MKKYCEKNTEAPRLSHALSEEPILLYTFTEEDKEIFADYQLKATQDEIRKNQYWKASSLERIGEKVVI